MRADKRERLGERLVELEEEEDVSVRKHRPTFVLGQRRVGWWRPGGLRADDFEIKAQLGLELAAGLRRVVLLDIHHGRVVVEVELQRPIGPVRVVLPLGPQPQALLRWARAGAPPDLLLELQQRLLFLDADRLDVVVRREVEEALATDLLPQIGRRRHARHRVQVRLLPLLLLAHLLLLLLLEGAAQMRRNVVGARLHVDLRNGRLAHVHKHVRIGDLWQLPLRRVAGVLLRVRPTELALDRLFLLHLGHALVVEPVPLLARQRADERIVVAAVETARVDKHRLQPVLIHDGRVGILREVLALAAVEIERGGELETLVDFRHRVCGKIVLESSEMQLEDGRQTFESDALLGVLLAETFRVILIISVERLLLDVLVERRVQILAALDWHLQIVEHLVTQ
mmetsp:Transcript_36569/g.85421  ORF Transcript_36569/g.85421 Transcript_36569/m.85421 type:complete len:398 (-) Transcript_36569:1040-2233(-)